MEVYQDHLGVEVVVEESLPHHQAACMGCTWVLEQLLVQTSWEAAV